MNPISKIFTRRQLFVAFLFALAVTPFARAASTSTNWDGLVFQLVIPKTNLVAGERIPVSMIVSNAVNRERAFSWKSGDPCTTSFGEFFIFAESSGKKIDCVAPPDERAHTMGASIDPLSANERKQSIAELAKPFALTNAGTYRVQAVGVFRYLDSPQSSFTLVTPPITLSISNAIKANVAARE